MKGQAPPEPDPLALPFDVYQRYRLVTDVLGRLRAAEARRAGEPGRRLRVLDVGGRTAVLRGFDREDDIALVDVEPMEGVAGLVLGDGARLPFQDGAFDVVCAFDTLEHVPPKARDAFVDECARVARSFVVLAGPYEAPEVVRAEELLQRFLVEKLHYHHRYLEEHRHNGLPDRARVEARLRAAGAEVRSLGHANLERWLALLSVSMYLDLEPALRGLAAACFRFYNQYLYASDHAAPVYRHAVIAALKGAAFPDLAGLLDAPAAPRGALAPFAELGRELMAFDRRRGEWQEVEEKLRETIATLERDLAEHAAALAGAQRTIEEKDAAVADMRAAHAEELAGAQRTIEEKDAAIADMQAAFAGERAGLAGTVAEQAAELGARDARIRALGTERDGLEGRAEQLAHQVAERDAVVAERSRDLAEHRAVLAARDAQVADQGAHIGNLEAHLADRNAELKRWPMKVLRRVMWLFFGKPPTA